MDKVKSASLKLMQDYTPCWTDSRSVSSRGDYSSKRISMSSVQIPNGTAWNSQCRPVNKLSLQLFHCPGPKSSGSLCVRM